MSHLAGEEMNLVPYWWRNPYSSTQKRKAVGVCGGASDCIFILIL
jgi:hypothetical protein